MGITQGYVEIYQDPIRMYEGKRRRDKEYKDYTKNTERGIDAKHHECALPPLQKVRSLTGGVPFKGDIGSS